MYARLAVVLIAWFVLTHAAAQTADPRPDSGRDLRRTPVVEVIERCRDAVVNISTTRVVRMRRLSSPFEDFFDLRPPRTVNRRVESVGSGVVVHASGYIVTNAHVVSQASDIQVTFADQRTLAARVVAVDPENDLAVLKVDAPGTLAAQPLGHSDDIMIGETVVAIGNPLGLQHTVTTGIISAINRDVPIQPDVVYRGLIQTDAPINPGNSGGPLLNLNGDLIGINSAIRGDAQNIGFAIPVDRLWEVLPSMLDIERRQRVRFGLSVSGCDARVVDVRPESPAAKADLKPGDRILRFNDESLRNGIDYYVHLLAQKPGNDVRLAVQRGDKTHDVSIPLVPIPLPDGAKLARDLLGLHLVEISPEMRRRYDLPDYAGLIVDRVDRGGPGHRARIEATDLILRLDRVPVVSLQDVGLALEQVRPGKGVVVEGLRLDPEAPFLWSVTLRAREAE